MTVAVVLIILMLVLVAAVKERREVGPAVADGRPWPLVVTCTVVAVLTVAWLVTALS